MSNTLELLSDITVYGKYARHVGGVKRRETWSEICQRNAEMHVKKYSQLANEIYEVYAKYVIPKKVFPSMRSLQFAGKAIDQSPSRMYNCSYLPVDHHKSFSETMFLLLGGSGVGISVQKEHIDGLPPLKGPKEREKRFLIGDSIQGWSDAIRVLMESYFFNKMNVQFDYSDIRQKGAYLVTAGGKAPGPQPLKDAIHNIRKVLDSALDSRGETRLHPIEAFSIMCHIADAVLAGGIRRSAIITLFDWFDPEMLAAKSGDWWENNPHYGRSNNSAVIYRNSDYTYDDFKHLWKYVENSGAGEPGVIFSNDITYGINPCAEVSLKSFGMCNLSEVVVDGVVSQQDLNDRVKAGAFLGTLQAGYTDFHYLRDIWRETVEDEALIGVGMTGIGSGDILAYDLREAANIVKDENARIADIIGINQAKRTTVIKPSGTSSLVAGTSSGIHAWHNDHYLRRMRLNKEEELYKYLSGIISAPYLEDEFFAPESTAVLGIPVKAPPGSIIRTESTMDLLERTRRFNREWIFDGHREGSNRNNVSVTVSIKDGEWAMVGDWMWANRDTFTGMAVLPYDGGTYQQAPFEDITEEEFTVMTDTLGSIQFDLTSITEETDETDLSAEASCAGGKCDI